METNTHIDQLGRRVKIPFPPRRIVSLVPSQTELLSYLGLTTEVVGITKFCVHPDEWFREKTRIGGTKKLHLDQIRALAPDLIIANKEENDPQQVKVLMEEFPVWVSDIHTLADAQEMISSIGVITGTSEVALQLNKQISEEFSTLTGPGQLKTAYFIWKDPWMVAGGDTFIHEMMKLSGLENVFAGLSRYPEVTLAELQATDCQLILLSSEPYPFKEKHIAELQELLPASKILLVDGEMYSWYGSRLLYAPAYFRSLFPPETVKSTKTL
ncbi:ABC-type Fe3+-hydroxamate transport system, substrate-binding protein [Chitinophaga sp. CF118]|uniref:ABC transporter substrate-binding protein n=1 Tax=Chitinophaga sp. CF118 TaxID=1884367 RepID=UPI0008F1B5D6|nr:helical backbone metal receptor [Chitinophaga sp. CF118]SFE91891.1 ABC-type Fe3+-hydroxamate transport system, substrate-binding protein [Chitinophaga sp. CF118]